MTGKEFSEKIETEFESFVPAKVAVQFNVLDEMHANENAHTRIFGSAFTGARGVQLVHSLCRREEAGFVRLPFRRSGG